MYRDPLDFSRSNFKASLSLPSSPQTAMLEVDIRREISHSCSIETEVSFHFLHHLVKEGSPVQQLTIFVPQFRLLGAAQSFT